MREFVRNFREKHQHNFVFRQIDRKFEPKIAIFGNFDEILEKNIQYRSKKNYENVYSSEIRNCLTKEYARKSIFMDKFVKKLPFFPPFGDMTTKMCR